MKCAHFRFLPLILLPLIVAVWLWPVTVLGRRPAGGDISAVDLPKMTYYQNALSDGRLPLWNEQIGFGRPILSEGQVGILYPINLLLYRCFQPHDAYTVGMLTHFVLAGWFAFLCARGFQLGRAGAFLAAVVFVGQGFFVGHLGQQWSYQTGCWLPLAVFVAWRWLEEEDWIWLFAVILVLAMQLLAGHFQLAFYTHVTVLALAVLSAPGKRLIVVRRGLLLLLALIPAAMLAAVQLLPTAEYVLQADTRGRGFDYLASFATPPLQLVNYVAPTLFQQHPLWEDVVWTASHTSRSVCLSYIGLIPLGLAVWAIRACRRQRETWVFVPLLCGSMLLSLGPNFPGFRWLIEWPGFGWFAAPARWSVVSGLFLGLLAGKGLEWIEPATFRRCSRYYVAAIAGILAVCVMFFIDVRGTEPAESHSPTESSEQSDTALLDLELLEYGYSGEELAKRHITPATELPRMLFDELWLPVLHWALLLGASLSVFRMVRPKTFTLVIIGWSIIDLGIANQVLRRIDFEPRGTSAKDSRTLSEATRYAPHRVAGTVGNFPMLVGVSSMGQPVIGAMQTYWDFGPRVFGGSTPTVPNVSRWGDIALMVGYRAGAIGEDEVEFLRLSGFRLIILGANQRISTPDDSIKHVRDVEDAWLTAHCFGGSSLNLSPTGRIWSFWELAPEIEVARAWLFPLDDPPEPGTDPRLFVHAPPARRRMLEDAIPLKNLVDRGEFVEITGATDSPAVLLLSDLYYPGWNAVLTQSGSPREVKIEPAFGNWRSVLIPQKGDFRVTFRFQPESFQVGRQISLATGVLWLLGCAALLTFRRRAMQQIPSVG